MASDEVAGLGSLEVQYFPAPLPKCPILHPRVSCFSHEDRGLDPAYHGVKAALHLLGGSAAPAIRTWV